MASSSSPVVQLQPLFCNNNNSRLSSLHASTSDFSLPSSVRKFFYKKKSASTITAMAQPQRSAMQYNQVGDSNLVVSEITFGTMTFGEQNTEKEAHEMLSYAVEHGINTLDTAEMYPVPVKKETQGLTDIYIGNWMKSRPRDQIILATKVSGYSERATYLRDNGEVVRVDAANIKESVEKSLKRLNTDYIDLLQIHWPDRYVPLFGEFFYDPSKWRASVSFVEQLRAFQELINEGKVRYIGVSNETSYGVMEFINAAKAEGLPKIVSIQNSYSLLVRCKFEVDLVEVCHPKNCNVGLLCYSPLAGGSLTGKYLDSESEASKKGRLQLFPGYMERYNKSISKDMTGRVGKLSRAIFCDEDEEGIYVFCIHERSRASPYPTFWVICLCISHSLGPIDDKHSTRSFVLSCVRHNMTTSFTVFGVHWIKTKTDINETKICNFVSHPKRWDTNLLSISYLCKRRKYPPHPYIENIPRKFV